MSRSIWKGPFNQNIDKHELSLLQNSTTSTDSAGRGLQELQSKMPSTAKPLQSLLLLRSTSPTRGGEKKRVWSRSSMILPQYVGQSFFVHNGKTFISIVISPKMLGHKFGEFASTRQRPVHKKKK